MNRKLAVTFTWENEKVKTEIFRNVRPEIDDYMIYKFFAFYRNMTDFYYDGAIAKEISNN